MKGKILETEESEMRSEIGHDPPDVKISYRQVTVRERLLRKLLGGKIQAAIIVPGDNVKLSIEEVSRAESEDE